jgi:hypothetical protein
MNNKNYFWVCFQLILSILFVVWCFNYAHSFRCNNSIGSEILTLIIPLWIFDANIKKSEEKNQKLKKQNHELLKKII